MLKLNESFASSRRLNLISKENYWRIRDNHMYNDKYYRWGVGCQMHNYYCYETR